jgi:hypothetical protein
MVQRLCWPKHVQPWLVLAPEPLNDDVGSLLMQLQGLQLAVLLAVLPWELLLQLWRHWQLPLLLP